MWKSSRAVHTLVSHCKKNKGLKVDQTHASLEMHIKAHMQAFRGFDKGAVKLVLGAQRPHWLATDSVIHKREDTERKGVTKEKKCEIKEEA